MRVRRLQRKDDQWFDDAYAFENSSGKVVFKYNLAWERTGSNFNRQIRERGISLEEVDTVILPSRGLRWLPIEIIAEDEAASYLEVLNEACAIPSPRSIAHRRVT